MRGNIPPDHDDDEEYEEYIGLTLVSHRQIGASLNAIIRVLQDVITVSSAAYVGFCADQLIDATASINKARAFLNNTCATEYPQDFDFDIYYANAPAIPDMSTQSIVEQAQNIVNNHGKKNPNEGGKP